MTGALKISKIPSVFLAAIAAALLLGFASAASATDLEGIVLYAIPKTSVGAIDWVGSAQTVGQNGRLAWLWTNSAGTNLNPSSFGVASSEAFFTTGVQQVGSGFGGTGTVTTEHALLWNGTAASAVDLSPASFANSRALGAGGGQQVGFGYVSSSSMGTNDQALVWTGTANSAVNLTPASITDARAIGTDGSQQVGYGSGNGTGNNQHALLWSGTAASMVDLNPSSIGISSSVADAISGTQEAGYGYGSGTGNSYHALLWSGTSASAIDLNPTSLGFVSSQAESTNGTEEAGFGENVNTGANQALLWTGTANSAIDLQTLLPVSGTWSFSDAYSVDSSGDVFGVAEGTYEGANGSFIVEWSSEVPEPIVLPMASVLGAILLSGRFRKTSAS